MPDSSATWSRTLQRRAAVAHLGERRRERGVVDDRLRAGVGEQVLQLLGDVAVVDVERREPGLERAEHRLEVLVAVVEVDREVVLPRLVAGEPLALDDGAEAAGEQRVREPPRAIGDLGPREPPVAEHDALAVRDRRGDRLVGRREVEVHPCEPKRLPPAARIEQYRSPPWVGTIPTSLDHFTPDWLSEALGEEVTAVEIEPVGQGVGILGLLARLHLTYATSRGAADDDRQDRVAEP